MTVSRGWRTQSAWWRVQALWLMIAAPGLVAAQRSRGSAANEVAIHVEPLAAGVRYARSVGDRWAVGGALTLGPFEGVTIDRTTSGDLKEWATVYATVAVEPTAGVAIQLSPLGAALAVGDDFGSVYPSAQAGLQLSVQRWRAGSDLRVIRIAGSGGTGHYWVQWIPIRIGWAWRW